MARSVEQGEEAFVNCGKSVQVTGVCVVGQVVQTDVDHAAAESNIEARDVQTYCGVVTQHLRPNVDDLDRVNPGAQNSSQATSYRKSP